MSERLVGHEQQITALRARRERTDDDRSQLQEGVRAYIMDHKLAVGCMGMIGVALADSNSFAQDVRETGTVMAALCGLGAVVDSAFRSEVVTVVDQLIQADSKSKALAGQLRQIDDMLATERAATADDQSQFQRIGVRLDSVQTALKAP